MKPILFNTEMVRAILEGRKSVTRRVVKPQMEGWSFEGLEENPTMIRYRKSGEEYPSDEEGLWACFEWSGYPECPLVKAPYRPGDTLYVRERWRVQCAKRFDTDVRIEYMAGGPMTTIKFPLREAFDAFVSKWADNKWHPSIHMPKEAARLFLRVTGVRVERLQDIDNAGARAEGCDGRCEGAEDGALSDWQKQYDFSVEKFQSVWDSTIKKADLPIYGWVANPWVWVIAFERIDKEAALDAGL